jgi:hypothetical protein
MVDKWLQRVRATLLPIPFIIAYMGFEFIARYIVKMGCHEFWVMLMAYFGFLWLIMWRAKGESLGREVHLH